MTSSPDDPTFEEQLGEALRATSRNASPPAAAECLDAVDLAAYLDRVLDDRNRRTVEAHLADCAACRRLAMAGALAMDDATAQTRRDPDERTDDGPARLSPRSMSRATPRGPRPAWPMALAAGLAALVAGLWWSPGTAPTTTPTTAPVDRPATASTGDAPQGASAGRSPLQRALRGDLRPVAPFAALAEHGFGEGRPALRRGHPHSLGRQASTPLSPRWSLITAQRPVFRWLATGVPAARPGASRRGEIFVVDGDEHLVATLPFEVRIVGTPDSGALSVSNHGPQVVEVPFPEILPPLEADRLYAWKVNLQVDGEPTASPFVPFLIRPVGDPTAFEPPPQAETESLDPRLVEAALLADDGYVEQALERLQGLDSTPGAEALLDGIMGRQRLPPWMRSWQRLQLGWPDETPSTHGAATPSVQP